MSFAPPGALRFLLFGDPPLKRWAIVGCPGGTNAKPKSRGNPNVALLLERAFLFFKNR